MEGPIWCLRVLAYPSGEALPPFPICVAHTGQLRPSFRTGVIAALNLDLLGISSGDCQWRIARLPWRNLSKIPHHPDISKEKPHAATPIVFSGSNNIETRWRNNKPPLLRQPPMPRRRDCGHCGWQGMKPTKSPPPPQRKRRQGRKLLATIAQATRKSRGIRRSKAPGCAARTYCHPKSRHPMDEGETMTRYASAHGRRACR